jgi:hypothetical protein
MVDLDQWAVLRMPIDRLHHATGGSPDRFADLGREVQPGVQRRAAGDRVAAEAETRAHRPVHRRGVWHHQRLHARFEQSGLGSA